MVPSMSAYSRSGSSLIALKRLSKTPVRAHLLTFSALYFPYPSSLNFNKSRLREMGQVADFITSKSRNMTLGFAPLKKGIIIPLSRADPR